jgi:hypothetical protein
VPHTLPEPAGTTWDKQQNSYLITNAKLCGHHPSAGPAPSPAGGIDHGHTAFTHASAVWKTMTTVDPNATWVYQAWPWMRSFITSSKDGHPTVASQHYMANFTSAVPPGRLVLLDMRCECEPVYARTKSFYGASFIFEVMDDFGGTSSLRLLLCFEDM